MAWVVDTCLVIDVLDDDPEFGRASASLLDNKAADGLILCPVSFVELAPAFLGDAARQRAFLEQIGIQAMPTWEWDDTQAAYKAWARYVALRRAGKSTRRPIADVLIGAFAATRQGLLTRNPSDFAPFFPDLVLDVPEAGKPYVAPDLQVRGPRA
ncbi:MAG: type II toxin-antitoxin system VapC family toxin [Vicinamibacterales bacterium]|nr:type II toxin-antitoxin system VapC family toxin [Vicinamibacterales bacterium]